MKKTVLILAVLIIFSAFTAFADSGYVYYNPESDFVVFFGEVTTGSALPVTLYTYKNADDYTIFKLENIVQNKISFESKMVDTAVNGEYTGKIILPSTELSVKFPYAKLPSADLTVSAKGAIDSGNLDSFIESYADILGLSKSFYSQNKASINKYYMLFTTKAALGSNLAVVKAVFSAVYYTKIVKGEPTDEILSSTRSFTGFDFDTYSKKTAAIKTGISKKLTAGVIEGSSFVNILNQADFLAYVEYGTKWNELKDYVQNTYRAYLPNVDFVKLSKLKSPDSVYISILGGSFAKISDFETEFNKKIDAQAKSEDGGGGGGTGTPSGGGSGGSGSGGGSFVEIVPDKSDTITDTKTKFHDLQKNHWSYEYVMDLHEKGIINGDGDGAFRPDSSITRAEFTKIIVEAFLKNTDEGENNFTDVKSGDWYEVYVKKAAFAGIIKGYDDGRFAPDENITRQDMAVILSNVFGNIVKIREFAQFSDYDEISDYALYAVEKLYTAGIINGMGDNTFVPTGNLTRAQAAAAIYLAERSFTK